MKNFTTEGVFLIMESTIVYIDGAYLSKICKYFGENNSYLKVDINQFAYSIAKNSNLWCTEVYYYTAPPFQSNPPSDEEIKMRRRYDKFVSNLKKINNFHVRERHYLYLYCI